MKEKEIAEKLNVPEKVEVKVEKSMITVKGPKGECKRMIANPKILISSDGKEVKFIAKKASKREKTAIWSYISHVKNMMHGVVNGYVYKLKICSGHFPMNASVSGGEFVVKNFLGEKKPRTVRIKQGANVKIEGEVVVVDGCDKELVGQTAANIEKLTRISNRDLRIFQDGIYITEMNGKPVRE